MTRDRFKEILQNLHWVESLDPEVDPRITKAQPLFDFWYVTIQTQDVKTLAIGHYLSAPKTRTLSGKITDIFSLKCMQFPAMHVLKQLWMMLLNNPLMST